MTQPRNQRDIRTRNLDTVLSAVSHQGLRTRASIAEATGLHKSSVTSLVGEFTKLGVLQVHVPKHGGAVGRPAAIIDVVPSMIVGLGLEIRANSLIAYVADLDGSARHQAAVYGPNRIRRPDSVLASLAALARGALADVERRQPVVSGVTIAAPGVIDAQRGVVVEAPDLGWSDVPALATFREQLNLPDVTVALDSTRSLAALAEVHDPLGSGLTDCLYVTGDGGVGARFLVGGEILRDHVADAFGHISVEAEGRDCDCGRRGCLAARTGRAALLAAAGLGDGSLPDLVEHLRAGDAHAVAAVADCGRWLGVGLANVVNLLAPPAIVLGGDFAALAPWLAAAIERELRVRVFGSTETWPLVTVSKVGADAAARGAAVTAVRRATRTRRAL